MSKYNYKFWLCLLAFLGIMPLFNSLVFAQEAINFKQGTWTEVVAEAKKQNKPIFVDFYATWCGPCKTMARNVFTDAKVAEFYNKNFISYKIDAEKEEMALVQSVQIEAYPSLYFFSANGEVITKNVGALGAKEFKSLGESVIQNMDLIKKLPDIQKKYEANPKDRTATANYLKVLVMTNKEEEAAKIAPAYLTEVKEKDFSQPDNWLLISKFAMDDQSREFKYVMSNSREFYELFNESYINYMLGTMNKKIEAAIAAKDETQMPAVKEIYSKVTTYIDTEKKPQEYHNQMLDMFYQQKVGEWGKYFKIMSGWMDNYNMKNLDELVKKSMEVLQFNQNPEELKKAEEWAAQAFKLEDNAVTNYVYASYLNKNGKKEQAKKHAQKAVSQNQEEEMKPYLETLMKEIEAK